MSYAVAEDIADAFPGPAEPFARSNRAKVPNVEGLYAITEGAEGRVLYIGEGRLNSRLHKHWKGERDGSSGQSDSRSSSNAQMIAGDIMVLPYLDAKDLEDIAACRKNLGIDYVKPLVLKLWWYRYTPMPGSSTAQRKAKEDDLLRDHQPLLCWPVKNGPRPPWSWTSDRKPWR